MEISTLHTAAALRAILLIYSATDVVVTASLFWFKQGALGLSAVSSEVVRTLVVDSVIPELFYSSYTILTAERAFAEYSP